MTFTRLSRLRAEGWATSTNEQCAASFQVARLGPRCSSIDHHMVGESSILLQRRWKNLLDWLEGHGFQAQNIPVECREMTFAGNGLFARRACMPGSILFAVPPRALMNKMTLKRLYPSKIRIDKALTAVQLISMHLFLWRPKVDEDSKDPSFGPYISILPRDFASHPLTWLVLSNINKADDLRIFLLDSLPPSVLAALHRLRTRFWDDWCKVHTFLQKTPSIALTTRISSDNLEAHDTIMDFLWAWLNVNTRCIYYRLKHAKSDPDNLTMCPALDFANHTPGQANMTPVLSNANTRNVAPVKSNGGGLKFTSPDNVHIGDNDEILLTYGLHSNKTLFVEYGFVNVMSEKGPTPSGEVDVQDLAESYILANVQFGEAVRARLLIEGYWGDWTLHSTADSAQPSWRLIAALRLYHLVVAVGSADEDAIQAWHDVVAGRRECVSSENEHSWRKTIVLLCDLLIERAERCIRSEAMLNRSGEDTWAGWMMDNIGSLWKEELFVGRVVKEGILRGDIF